MDGDILTTNRPEFLCSIPYFDAHYYFPTELPKQTGVFAGNPARFAIEGYYYFQAATASVDAQMTGLGIAHYFNNDVLVNDVWNSGWFEPLVEVLLSADMTAPCAGANATPCVASDQCHAVGTCAADTGLCTNPNEPDGTPCDDGDACTQGDTCRGGVCTGGSAVTSDAGACAPPACTFVLVPASAKAAAAGATGTDGVSAGAGCAWTAASNASWLHVTSGSPGTGNGVVGYTADPNSATSARTGSSPSPGNVHRDPGGRERLVHVRAHAGERERGGGRRDGHRRRERRGRLRLGGGEQRVVAPRHLGQPGYRQRRRGLHGRPQLGHERAHGHAHHRRADVHRDPGGRLGRRVQRRPVLVERDGARGGATVQFTLTTQAGCPWLAASDEPSMGSSSRRAAAAPSPSRPWCRRTPGRRGRGSSTSAARSSP